MREVTYEYRKTKWQANAGFIWMIKPKPVRKPARRVSDCVERVPHRGFLTPRLRDSNERTEAIGFKYVPRCDDGDM